MIPIKIHEFFASRSELEIYHESSLNSLWIQFMFSILTHNILCVIYLVRFCCVMVISLAQINSKIANLMGNFVAFSAR